jgi:hypothetical protein
MRTQEHADRRPTSFRRSLAVTASGALIAALAACGGGAGGDEAAASGAKIDAKADPRPSRARSR